MSAASRGAGGLAARAVGGLAPGDHACCLFGSDDEHGRIVARWARDAFANDERLFYIADRSDQDTVVAFLDDAGLDGRGHLEDGSLLVLHSSEMSLDDGFDIERQLEVWSGVVRDARADGFTGVAAFAEMSWALSWMVDADTLIKYEADVQRIFASAELRAVCMYDRRLFDAKVLAGLLRTHPVGISLGDAAATVACRRMTISEVDGAPELTLHGEIDLGNIRYLESWLADHSGSADLVVDCAGLSFIDLPACRALRSAATRADTGGRAVLRNVPPAVARVFNLCSRADGAAARLDAPSDGAWAG